MGRQKNCLAVILLMLIVAFGCSLSQAAASNTPSLFYYTRDHVMGFLRRAGYSNLHPNKIRRNSNGTALYIYDLSGNDKNNTILVVSGNGKIIEMSSPGKLSYLNDNLEYVLWYDDIKEGAFLRSGSFVKVEGLIGVDAGGKYFFTTDGMNTHIISISKPNIALASSKFRATKIYSSTDKILLFGIDLVEYKNSNKHGSIICHVFDRHEGDYKLSEEIVIHRPTPRSSPFSVVDMNMKTGDVLVTDTRDAPFYFMTKWYLYNIPQRCRKWR